MANPTKTAGPTAEEEKAAVSIDAARINDEFIRVPSDLAYWNRTYAVALNRLRMAESARERVEAELRLAFRTEAEQSGQKVTEGTLDALVVANTSYQSASSAEMSAEHEKNLANGVVDAIRTKRDMLISLGANLREEMKRDPMIRESPGNWKP